MSIRITFLTLSSTSLSLSLFLDRTSSILHLPTISGHPYLFLRLDGQQTENPPNGKHIIVKGREWVRGAVVSRGRGQRGG